MTDELAAFWFHADLEDPSFNVDEVKRWPANTLGLLESLSLIRRSEDSRLVECDACGDGHAEEVEILTEPAGTKPRGYIMCPEVGRVAVDLERLQRWSIDLEALARTVAVSLDVGGRIIPIVPGRVWLLGTRPFVERLRDVFLVRGVGWSDNLHVLGSATRLANAPFPLILCLNRFPADSEWQNRNRVVFSLAEVAWLVDQRAMLAERISSVLRDYSGPIGSDRLTATPVANRAELMLQIRSRYNYRVADIFQGAKVDRSYLNKWKLGSVKDDSEPSRRIEQFLRQHGHKRRADNKRS